MKTIYVVFKRARQYDGDYHFIATEKAFTDQKKAEEYWRQQSRMWQENINGIDCECERHIHPVELDEE